LVNRLDAEQRQATPEEQALLAKFTGWGAGEIRNNLFRTVTRNPDGSRKISPPTYGEWKELGQRASRLLTGDALETALQSTQYAHYTSEAVIRSIWSGLRRLGFNGGKIVEPGMGTGLFAVAGPSDVMGNSNYTGIELDGFTAKVASYLLPQETIIPGDYTKTKLPDGFFDIAIGNPPFADIKVTDDPPIGSSVFPCTITSLPRRSIRFDRAACWCLSPPATRWTSSTQRRVSISLTGLTLSAPFACRRLHSKKMPVLRL
jgi:hypothetical protein